MLRTSSSGNWTSAYAFVETYSLSSGLNLRNSYCEGGHGLSIGSLGKGGQVADVQNVLYVIIPNTIQVFVDIGQMNARIENVFMVNAKFTKDGASAKVI